MKTKLVLLFLLFVVSGCKQFEATSNKSCAGIEVLIRQYYIEKYPAFAQISKLNTQQLYNPENQELLSKLIKASPVSAFANSYPTGPYFTYIERTLTTNNRILETRIDLRHNDDGTCRIVVSQDKKPNDGLLSYGTNMAITGEAITDLIK